MYMDNPVNFNSTKYMYLNYQKSVARLKIPWYMSWPMKIIGSDSPHVFYMLNSDDKLSCLPSSFPAEFLQNRKLDLE